MPPESHRLMDGALHVDRRENSRYWQCSFCLGSRNHRQTTRGSALQPPRILRGWHMERCVEDRRRRRGGAPLLDGPVQPLIAGPGASADGWRRRTPPVRVSRPAAPARSVRNLLRLDAVHGGNTGHRPDESARHELRDVKIVNDQSTGERILGDRGLRHAGRAFLRVDARLRLIEGRTFMRSPRLAAPAWR